MSQSVNVKKYARKMKDVSLLTFVKRKTNVISLTKNWMDWRSFRNQMNVLQVTKNAKVVSVLIQLLRLTSIV